MIAPRAAAFACAVLVAGCAASAARSDDPPPPGSPVITSAPPAPVDARPAGQRSYARHCLSCHQADGGGVPNMQPAIVGGNWVRGDGRALALFVLTGGFDSASRKDGGEGNVMPPFRQLTDADLAELLSYVRREFGQGAPPITAATVAEARATLP